MRLAWYSSRANKMLLMLQKHFQKDDSIADFFTVGSNSSCCSNVFSLEKKTKLVSSISGVNCKLGFSPATPMAQPAVAILSQKSAITVLSTNATVASKTNSARSSRFFTAGYTYAICKKNRSLTSVPQHVQQDNANVLPQYQHPPQMLASPAGQPWLSSVSQSAAAVTSVQQAGVQLSGNASSDAAANTTNPNSASDWEEHAVGDGRRYYYNKTQGNFRLRVVEGEFTDS
ncbi:hypothetical protein KIW84_057879 [Lathyrus oleraceus]|uniref:Uncharacterized protein n=1 Tax=Pisum sativum TaxID=3888 RepID=A0A9D5ALM8_PEA|nr:hypothetical protein KIW84_057879 [Pisum sativum]